MPHNARRETHPYHERAGLDPAATGLDMRIYVATRAYVALAPRLTVLTQDGQRLAVSLSVTPQILAAPDRSTLRHTSWEKLAQYIRLHLPILLAYWYAMIGTDVLARRLQRLARQEPPPVLDAL